ncbi:MAG: ribosome-associated translation inhibitor RaiA [Clostridioides sp.]|jgi:putative sigma-54 modulation protein|nr:ribosome-associated translation inhibitor RaiA [Clostridioides sp.]
MKLTVSALQMRVTDGIRGYIDEKFGKFEKYLGPDTEIKVKVSAKKDRHKVEVTVGSVNGRIVRAEDVEDDLYTAIDIVSDKLTRQIVKYKGKFKTRQPGAGSIRFEAKDVDDEVARDYEELEELEDFEDEIVSIERRKKFNMKPMSPEEAILQMELVGHNFFIFTNQDTFETNVVYKRHANGYGLIEQE